MNNHMVFRPNLVDCILEERVAPAIANLAIIILTTNGLTLIEAFPGANSSGAATSSSGGGTAASVSGVAIPTSLYITGTGGISSLKPGNITGVPSLGGSVVGGGVAISIQVGSGADTGGGPTNSVSNGGATNNTVGLTTVADPTARPTMTVIGGVSSSGSSSPVLPPGQSYRDSAPVQASSSLSTVPQSTTTGPRSISDPYAPNPQAGAPTLGPFNMNRTGGLNNPISNGLVPMNPMSPGNN